VEKKLRATEQAMLQALTEIVETSRAEVAKLSEKVGGLRLKYEEMKQSMGSELEADYEMQTAVSEAETAWIREKTKLGAAILQLDKDEQALADDSAAVSLKLRANSESALVLSDESKTNLEKIKEDKMKRQYSMPRSRSNSKKWKSASSKSRKPLAWVAKQQPT